MPLSLMTLSVVASPVTLQEGLKILERGFRGLAKERRIRAIS